MEGKIKITVMYFDNRRVESPFVIRYDEPATLGSHKGFAYVRITSLGKPDEELTEEQAYVLPDLDMPEFPFALPEPVPVQP